MTNPATAPDAEDAAAEEARTKAEADAWWQRHRAGRFDDADWRNRALDAFARQQQAQLKRLAKLEGR